MPPATKKFHFVITGRWKTYEVWRWQVRETELSQLAQLGEHNSRHVFEFIKSLNNFKRDLKDHDDDARIGRLMHYIRAYIFPIYFRQHDICFHLSSSLKHAPEMQVLLPTIKNFPPFPIFLSASIDNTEAYNYDFRGLAIYAGIHEYFTTLCFRKFGKCHIIPSLPYHQLPGRLPLYNNITKPQTLQL